MHEDDYNLGLFGGEIPYENVFQFLTGIFKHALVITAFVIIMMLLIDNIMYNSNLANMIHPQVFGKPKKPGSFNAIKLITPPENEMRRPQFVILNNLGSLLTMEDWTLGSLDHLTLVKM